MKKIISKIMAVVMMLAMVLTSGILNPITANAAEEGVKIHVYNTLGWENVYVHSWSEGSNAPELTLMAPSESENWYEFTFDSTMGTEFEFLLYNGEWQGFNQTANVQVTSADELYYVIQAELGEGDLSSSAGIVAFASEMEAENEGYPSYTPDEVVEVKTEDTISSLTVYFKNVLPWEKAGINAWGDNEATLLEMTDLENGWFEYVFETPVSNNFNFMFFDVEAFAAETYGAGYQTGDVKEFSANTECIWIIPTDEGDLTNGVYTVKEDAAWPGPEIVAEETVEATVEGTEVEASSSKLYFKNSDLWSKAFVWAWTMEYTDQMVANPWPGDEMTDLGNGWMLYEFQASEDYAVLFNNGEEAQTADCSGLVPGKTYWFATSDGSVVNETGIGGGTILEVYEEPQAGWPEGPEAIETMAESDSSNVLNVWFIVIGVVVVGAIGCGVVVANKKKRNK